MMNQRFFEVEVTTMESFAEVVRCIMEEYFGDGYSVSLMDVSKTNGLVLTGLVIKEDKVNIAPTIYLNGYYERFADGASMETLCEDIIKTYLKARKTSDFDVKTLTSFASVKKDICFKLVNAKMNEESLESVPHVILHDLAVVFYVLVSKDWGGVASILVRDELQEIWGVSAEELYQIALSNTPKHFPVTVTCMADILKERAVQRIGEEAELLFSMFTCNHLMPKMYVVTNKEVTNGAVSILYSGFLKEFTEEIGRNVYILPSSVHGTILLPDVLGMNADELKEMVQFVNETELTAEEKLSDNVYYYNRNTDRIEIL